MQERIDVGGFFVVLVLVVGKRRDRPGSGRCEVGISILAGIFSRIFRGVETLSGNYRSVFRFFERVDRSHSRSCFFFGSGRVLVVGVLM